MGAETRHLTVQRQGQKSERGHLKAELPRELRHLKGTRQRKDEQDSAGRMMAVTVNLGTNFINVTLDAKKGESNW